jgi:predicted transcriptional regulator
MDLDNIFTSSKWKILNELAKNQTSPTELSKKINTSIANISTQLRFLKALGFVKSKTLKNNKIGKPKTLYSLSKEFAYLVLAKNNFCSKKILKLNNFHKTIFSIYFLNESDLHYYLLKFYFKYENILKECNALGFIGLKDKNIELLAINQNKEKTIKKFQDIEFSNNSIKKKILVNVYTKEEFENGVKAGDNYFNSIINKCYILFDPDNILYYLKTDQN